MKNRMDIPWPDNFLIEVLSPAPGGFGIKVPTTTERHAATIEVINSLPGKAPDIISMRYRDGMTFNDISKKLGITASNANGTVHRAIDKITHDYQAMKLLRLGSKEYSKWDLKKQKDIPSLPIEELRMSKRVTNALKHRCLVNTIGDVIALSSENILHARGIGSGGYNEIRNALIANGLDVSNKPEIVE